MWGGVNSVQAIPIHGYHIYYVYVPLKEGSNTYLDISYATFITPISINSLVVYRESVNLIGYLTRRLSADSLQLCTSRAVFETFELPM